MADDARDVLSFRREPRPFALPDVPQVSDPQLRAYLRALKEVVETRLIGGRGGLADRALTYRDALAAGLIEVIDGAGVLRGTGTPVVGTAIPPGVVTDGPLDNITPPAPTGLQAAAALAGVLVQWDAPDPDRVAYTEVFSNGTDNLGTAVLIGTSQGRFYADAVGATGVTKYYWVRFVARGSQELRGPFNAVGGTAATTGRVGSSDLANALVLAQHLANGSVTADAVAFALGGGNLIPNPSFEIDSNSDNIPDNWNQYVGTGATVNAWEWLNDIFYHGTRSVWMNAALDNNEECGWSTDSIGIRPGEKYTFAFRHRISLTGARANAVINWHDAAQAFISQSRFQKTSDSTTTGSEWHIISVTGTAPANAAFAVCYCIVRNNSGGTLAGLLFRVDAAQLQAGDVPSSFPLLAANTIVAGDGVIANAAIGNAQIQNAAIDNAKILNVDAGKINTGFLSADRVQFGSLDTKIAVITNAQIQSLDAGKITTGLLNADRLNVGIGTGNMLVNSGPAIDAPFSGWLFTWDAAGRSGKSGPYLETVDWNPRGLGAVAMFWGPGPAANDLILGDLTNAPNNEHRWIPVVAGQRYEASAYIEPHRCKAEVRVAWYDANRNYINEIGGSLITAGGVFRGSLSGWRRSVLFAPAPANAAYAQAYVRSYGDGQSDPYTFFSAFYFGAATSNQNVASPWTPSGLGTQIHGGMLLTDSVDANRLSALQIAVGKYIRSSNYAAGSAGWNIDGAGAAEFQNVTVRGDVQASSLIANIVDAPNIITSGAVKFTTGSYNSGGPFTATGSNYDLTSQSLVYTADRTDSMFLLAGHLHLYWGMQVDRNDAGPVFGQLNYEVRPVLDGVSSSSPLWYERTFITIPSGISTYPFDFRRAIPLVLSWAVSASGARTLALRIIANLVVIGGGGSNMGFMSRAESWTKTIVELKRQRPEETQVTTPRVITPPVVTG